MRGGEFSTAERLRSLLARIGMRWLTSRLCNDDAVHGPLSLSLSTPVAGNFNSLHTPCGWHEKGGCPCFVPRAQKKYVCICSVAPHAVCAMGWCWGGCSCVKTPIIIIMMDTVEGREEFPATRASSSSRRIRTTDDFHCEQTAPLYFGKHEIIYLVDASCKNLAAQASLGAFFALSYTGDSDVFGGGFFVFFFNHANLESSRKRHLWGAINSAFCNYRASNQYRAAFSAKTVWTIFFAGLQMDK